MNKKQNLSIKKIFIKSNLKINKENLLYKSALKILNNKNTKYYTTEEIKKILNL